MLRWVLFFFLLAIGASICGYGALCRDLAVAATALLLVFLLFCTASGILYVFGVGRRS